MNENEYGVHISHCCIKCGCKYGNEDCPVALGLVKQKYNCCECDYVCNFNENEVVYVVNNPITMWCCHPHNAIMRRIYHKYDTYLEEQISQGIVFNDIEKAIRYLSEESYRATMEILKLKGNLTLGIKPE